MHIRRTVTVAALILVVGHTAHAQDAAGHNDRAQRFAATTILASGAASGQFSMRVTRRVVLFAETGHLRSLETPTTQAGLDQSIVAMAPDPTGVHRVQTGYSIGGVRLNVLGRSAVTPYLFSGIGAARLTSPALLTYEGGPTLGEGAEAAANPAMTALILKLGGGLQMPVGKHLVSEVGYALSRVPSSGVEAHGMTFGLAVKF